MPLPNTNQTQSRASATNRSDVYEGYDAVGSRATGYKLGVGDRFVGALDGDADWVRVELQPGTYTVALTGIGYDYLRDPRLQVLDARGNQLAVNDDFQGLDSLVMLTVTRPGSYYLVAGSFGSTGSGDYALTITAPFSNAQIARQLTNGYWESQGLARRAFDVDPGDVLTVDLTGLDAAGRKLALAALGVWTDASGIRFRAVSPGRSADITFDDSDSGAYAESMTIGGEIISSFVNVGRDWLDAYGTGFATYSFQSYIHEIGHALGLGHAGNYNSSAFFGLDNHFSNDSWQSSVMSYFSQSENPAVSADEAYVMSAMAADILAIRSLYGQAALRTGNTIYGEDSNAGGNYARISTLLGSHARDDIVFAILDNGGIDTLDLDGDRTNQRINLTPGAASSAYGRTGNIIITADSLIENLRAGSGSDQITGNAARNTIWGNAGNDVILGNAGNDNLIGGAGNDRLNGGTGNDRLAGSYGNDVLIGGGQADMFVFDRGRDTIRDFQNNIDTLQIDDALWGGGARSIAQVLRMASVVDGDTVFRFAGGHTLTLDNYSRIASLSDDLAII